MDAYREPQRDVEEYQGHTIVYDQGPTSWGAVVEDMPVCVAVADTREDCERQIHASIAVYADALERDKRERPHLYAEPVVAYRG